MAVATAAQKPWTLTSCLGIPSSMLVSRYANVQEHGDLLTLVALELDNLAELLVVHERTVAGELLLERLQQLFGVIL